MEALADQMIGVVIGTDLVRPWAVAVAAVTPPLLMTITTTAAALLEAIVLVAMITAVVHRRASFMTGGKEDMDVRRLVVACPMSMAHHVRATLTILTMPGPDLHPVAMTILT